MSLLLDHFHRLSQSPDTASWVARIGAAVAIVAAARLILLLAGGPQLPWPAPHAPPPVLDRSPVSKWHLFGVPGAEAALEATTLSLTLRGTVAADHADRGVAIIAEKGQKDAGYHVGESLPGGGVLESIDSDHVIIRNAGKREMLALTNSHAGAGGPAAISALAAPAPSPTVLANIVEQSVRQASSVPTIPTPPAVGVDAVNVMPVLENGKVIGARLSTSDVASMERLGLRRDDVIVAVDGAAINDPQANGKIATALRAGNPLNLVVRRDGREQTVRVGK